MVCLQYLNLQIVNLYIWILKALSNRKKAEFPIKNPQMDREKSKATMKERSL